MELARTARYWGTTPSRILAGSVRDFTLDRLLAIRMSEEDQAEQDEGDGPPRAATRALPTDWTAPNLPI